jgi:signal recognition particle subunit SRP54
VFENLSTRLDNAFARLRRKGKLTKADVEEGLKEIRLALLEADVAVPVVRNFVERVREEAVGEKVLRSLTPGQQIVKVVNDELVRMLGSENRPMHFATEPPTVVLLVGLQGSGKTTAAAKLANLLKDRKPLLAACDLQRPGAVEQLRQLGAQIGVPVEGPPRSEPEGRTEPNGDPIPVAKRALTKAVTEGHGVLIVDSAGRLAIDEELMRQAKGIRDAIKPTETFLVLDSMTGQDAVQTASAFNEKLEPTGAILTKLDGDARGGAALSLVEVTGLPIVFAAIGERIEDLEAFYPDRMASRILGMGDVLTLIERAEQQVTEEEAEALERKMREEGFDLSDFLDQLRMVKKMGPLSNVLGMLPKVPGIGKISDDDIDEYAIVRTEAIIQSMTPDERARPMIIDSSRRSRIARGSGTKPQDVSQLIKQFDMMRKMMKQAMGGIPGLGRKSRKARKNLPKMKGF